MQLARPVAGAGQYLLSIVSTGCRECRFVCASIEIARTVALRFANISVERLALLTADAAGTTSHPRPGNVAYVPVILPDGQVEIRRGRHNGSQIFLFPYPSEIRDALEEIGTWNHDGANPALPVIDRVSINDQIPSEVLSMFAFGPDGWTLPSLHNNGPTLTHHEGPREAALGRLDYLLEPESADAAERVQRFEEQLANGEVELPAPKPREHRVIDLE